MSEAVQQTMTEEFVALVTRTLLSRAADRDAEGAASAGVYRRVAADIDDMLRQWMAEPITLAEAVRLSGYTEQGLRAWLRRMNLTPADLCRAMLPRAPLRPTHADERSLAQQVAITKETTNGVTPGGTAFRVARVKKVRQGAREPVDVGPSPLSLAIEILRGGE